MGALLVLVSSCKPALERLKASTGDARPDMSERQWTTIALVKGMVVLLMEYIPALFLCGFSGSQLQLGKATEYGRCFAGRSLCVPHSCPPVLGGRANDGVCLDLGGVFLVLGFGGNKQYQGNAIPRRWVRLCWPVWLRSCG